MSIYKILAMDAMYKKFIIILLCIVLGVVIWHANKKPKKVVSAGNDPNVKWEKFSSPEAAWNGRELIISTTLATNIYAINDIPNNTSESKQHSNISVEPDKILCPLVEKIQKTAQNIDKAFFSHGSYGITSQHAVFHDSNLGWIVGVVGIVAGSSDEAIHMAGIATRKTHFRKNEYAEKLDKSFSAEGLHAFFVCYYGPGDVMVIGVWNKIFVNE